MVIAKGDEAMVPNEYKLTVSGGAETEPPHLKAELCNGVFVKEIGDYFFFHCKRAGRAYYIRKDDMDDLFDELVETMNRDAEKDERGITPERIDRCARRGVYTYHFDAMSNVIRKGIPISVEDCPADVVLELLGGKPIVG